MSAAMIVAALLAGASATFLSLVDAGREIDGSLSRLERQAVALRSTTSDSMARGAPAEAVNRPRTSLRKGIDAFSANADRIVRDSATPPLGGIAQWVGERLDLVPDVEAIDKAYGEYLEQTKQALAESRQSESAATLARRLLDLSSEQLVQRVEDARDRTREAVARSLNGLQLITFISIGIAALVVGLTPDQYS
jgi:hypothetical protein